VSAEAPQRDYVGRPLARSDLVARRARRILRPRWFALFRTTPLSPRWGADRGLPVDRYYIERFLDANRGAIRGSVLEIKRPLYTERFGIDVQERNVLDVDPANEHATILADLTQADAIPGDAFDCFILTQTLQYVYDVRAAIRQAHRILRPGGVLLCTVPSVSRIEPGWLDGEFWRFTRASCRRLFEESFGEGNVAVTAHGNVLAAASFLAGVAADELGRPRLDESDEYFPLLLTVRAEKRTTA
jgi:SAM-dependent methyltransferase